MNKELTEKERAILFYSRNLDYRMNKWTPEEQHDKAGIPRLRSELTDNDKTFLELTQKEDDWCYYSGMPSPSAYSNDKPDNVD